MKMSYETFLKITETTQRFQLETAEDIANRLMKEYEEDDSDDTALISLYELARMAIDQKKIIGTSDNFHNFAVTYARIDAEDIACEIVEKGLEKFPESVDLLADYIKYGNSAGEAEKCKEYLEKLMSISKKAWNWRAFSFVIDYLLDKIGANPMNDNSDDAGIISTENEIMELANCFKETLPHLEEAYISASAVYKAFNDKINEEKELEYAVATLERSPKCALRLADIYFNKGEYEKALDMAKKCQNESPEPQPGTSFGYPYLLSALCRISLYYKNSSNDNESELQRCVKEVYNDFRIARKLVSESSLLKNLKSQIEIFENRTGTNSDDYDL